MPCFISGNKYEMVLMAVFSDFNITIQDLLLTHTKHIGIQNQFILRYKIILILSNQCHLYPVWGFGALKSSFNCACATEPTAFI